MSDRGMMKWAPYKSLIEQEDELKRWRKNRDKVSRPILMEDKIEQINEFLSTYHNQLCELTYYREGYIIAVRGFIKRLDLNSRLIYIEDEIIKINELIDAEDINEDY